MEIGETGRPTDNGSALHYGELSDDDHSVSRSSGEQRYTSPRVRKAWNVPRIQKKHADRSASKIEA